MLMHFRMLTDVSLSAQPSPRPQFPEGFGGLVHQLHRVGQE
jgi:hypothetical protein